MSFIKNDSGFKCVKCGAEVPPLKFSSRDHCTQCLTSLHVDIEPGDRLNECRGYLHPIRVELSAKKGYIIIYECDKCNELKRCKSAPDDNFEKLLQLFKNQ